MEKAETLENERNVLRLDVHRLEEALSVPSENFDGIALHHALDWFNTESDRLSQLTKQSVLRWLLKGIEWGTDGTRRFVFHGFEGRMGKKKNQSLALISDDWFDTILRTGGPDHRTFEPWIYRLRFLMGDLLPKLEMLQFRV